MGETISAYEHDTSNGIEVNAAALEYYRNGKYLQVRRHVERCSQLDLLPIYSWFARSKSFFKNAKLVAGNHSKTKVSLAEFFLKDSASSLETLTFDNAQLGNPTVVEPTTYTVEAVNGRIKAGRSGSAVLKIFLALDSPDRQSALEIETIEQAFRSSDIGYRHKRNARHELYLGKFHAPDGFNDAKVDEFLDTLIDEAPLAIQTEPFAVPTVDLAA